MNRHVVRHVVHLVQHWSTRPCWAGGLLLLVIMVAFGGPVACIVHCSLAGMTHHMPSQSQAQHLMPPAEHAGGQPHQAQTPVAAGTSQATDCTLSGHSSREPSPLTIAVIVPLFWMVFVGAMVVRLLLPTLLLPSAAFPPPLPPPQHLLCAH